MEEKNEKIQFKIDEAQRQMEEWKAELERRELVHMETLKKRQEEKARNEARKKEMYRLK